MNAAEQLTAARALVDAGDASNMHDAFVLVVSEGADDKAKALVAEGLAVDTADARSQLRDLGVKL